MQPQTSPTKESVIAIGYVGYSFKGVLHEKGESRVEGERLDGLSWWDHNMLYIMIHIPLNLHPPKLI